ncbi:hypothetical protein P2318_20690 [Myxococcaceae bacterium GXIMD 01537]
MKRLILTLALFAGLVSCSETESVPTTVGLTGTYDLTLVDRLVFVTSSDLDELRVLDLDSSPRSYVRAPNPLESLAIPVLDRPIALAKDTVFKTDGFEGKGPYVYARSAGSQEISVVGAAPTQLRELRRLIAPGIVTAIAARGPAAEGAPSQLFFATQSSAGAQLWLRELPGPDVLEGATLADAKPVLALPPGETVQALLVLPEPNQLVVATRTRSGRGGRTLRLNVTAPDQFLELNFGAPVRQLATHPKVVRIVSQDPLVEEELLSAGQRIFGILDETACGGLPGCTGVLSVDSATGAVSKDVSGFDMLPITTGRALPTGITLAVSAQLLVVEDGQRVIRRFPLLGIVPASDGNITIFNALELRDFDFDPDAASVDLLELRTAADAAKATPRQSLTAEVVNFATQSATYRIIYQSALPGLIGLSREAGTTNAFEVPAESANAVSLTALSPGDIVVPVSDTGLCSVGGDLTITELRAGEGGRTLLVTDKPVPVECADFPRFSVLAGGARPFAVFQDPSAYLGRMGPNETFTVGGAYFFHPVGFNPAVPPDQVRLTMAAKDPEVLRGDRYVVSVNGQFVPYIVRVNTTDSQFGLTAFRLPASVVYATADDDTSYAYIAYPSADGILQMNLELIYFDQVNQAGLKGFQ